MRANYKGKAGATGSDIADMENFARRSSTYFCRGRGTHFNRTRPLKPSEIVYAIPPKDKQTEEDN